MSTNSSPSSARAALPLVPAVLLAAWLVGVDVWVKTVARLGACPGMPTGPWTAPTSCTEIRVAGELALIPAVRDGLPGAPLADLLTRQLAMLLVLAAVTIATIAVVRARNRQPADLLALACLWAGAVIWAAPVLAGPGFGFTELVAGGVAFGVGDVAAAVGLLWFLVERVRA